MSSPRQVVVIGAGPAGYACAIRLAQLGQKATVVEKEEVGGTCLNVGCVPSKALIAAGALYDKIGRASVMGLTAKDVAIDVQQLVEWKSGVVQKLTGGVAGLLKRHGVEVVRGTGRLQGRGKVVVEGEGGERTLACDDIVIATGSAPIAIPGFPFDEDAVWSSTGALAPKRLPQHLVVIGGGYIGLELGMVYRKLGSEVTVLEATDRVLPGQEPDCVRVIERSLKKMGVRVVTKGKAQGYERRGEGLVVRVATQEGEETISCDQILSTVGRRPYSEGLGLDSVGLEVDERGFLPIDARLCTKVEGVYAIGDIAGQPMLAHKGTREGLVCAAVIAGQPEEYDARCVPAVIFTSPEMASVGMTEDQARAAGREPVAGTFNFGANARAMTLLEAEGFVKVVADAATDEVLGVHMVGPDVTELIAEAALAIELGATSEDIARTIHAHPTLPEALMEAAESVHGMAVHMFQTPGKKRS